MTLSFPCFLLGELCCQGKGASFSFHNYLLLFGGVVPKLLRQYILLTLIKGQKNFWRLQRPHQTYSHDLHCKITGLARRFNPETVLRQDTLLLYNPKECRGKKNLSFFPP